MPLPLIIGIGAAVAGAAGIGSGIYGGVKTKKANDTMKSAESRHNTNIKKLERQNKLTLKDMDDLGVLELTILKDFDKFNEVFETIQNKPEMNQNRNKEDLPQYDQKEIERVSIGAGVLLGGIAGAALGTAGGFAAAGATTAAVAALACASTGTPITALAGAAATNATLAALGGGALAAGGGGMALGQIVLGGAALGVGLLVGGVAFSITGRTLSKKADEAYAEMLKSEKNINNICSYLIKLSRVANDYRKSLEKIRSIYQEHLDKLMQVVYIDKKTDWNEFTNEEKMLTENTTLLVALLHKMCKLEIVSKAQNKDGINDINESGVHEMMKEAECFTEGLKQVN